MPSPLPASPFRVVLTGLLTLALLVPGLSAQVPSGQPGPPSLLPGDALALQIWREPDLSGRFIVDEDGIVTLPLLGRIHVTGIPIPQLRDQLIEGFERQLRNPAITVIPLRRIYVLGEVNRPGLLEVDPTVTLAGAVALAGGANWEGDLRRLRIMRDGVVLAREIGPEADLLSMDIRSGDQIFVGRRRWIERHSTFLVSATIGVASIIVTLLR
jgi:protein involved in polysaccharide export with SLBB domain